MLSGLLILYLAASLLHFVHNAEQLAAYPHVPAWITRASVYLAWLGITAVGALGYWRHRLHRDALGLALLGVYAAAGLDGLLHYTLAPVHAHTLAMNFTIWFEVIASAILLAYILLLAGRRAVRPRGSHD